VKIPIITGKRWPWTKSPNFVLNSLMSSTFSDGSSRPGGKGIEYFKVGPVALGIFVKPNQITARFHRPLDT
jgi:hypothetical protein